MKKDGDEFIIAGIDAGNTSAIAVLDLNGRLVFLKSKKGYSREEVLRDLEPFKPAIVASDTNPANGLCLFVKSSFLARLFVPKKSLSLGEKRALSSTFCFGNSHERDALAAALKAFHSIENKMRYIDCRRFSSFSPSQVKEMVLSGKRMPQH